MCIYIYICIHSSADLQVGRERDALFRLPVGGHVVDKPRGEAYQVARLGEEVLVVVEGRHGLEVPLARVLLIVVHRRRAAGVDEGDGRGGAGSPATCYIFVYVLV